MSKKDQPKAAIAIGKKAAEKARMGLRHIENFNIFLSGVRAALNVPEGWEFDAQQMAFVPPEKGPTK